MEYRNQNNLRAQRKFKPFRLILVLFVLLPVLAAGAGYLYYQNAINTANDGSSAQQLVVIDSGTSARTLSQQLEEANIIQNARIFEIYLRVNGLEDDIIAGNFETQGNLKMEQVFEDLQNPIAQEVTVTIPEGLRYDQIADRLDQIMRISPNWSKEEFLEIAENPDGQITHPILFTKDAGKSLEGFLYPDTYIYSIEASTTEVMTKMLDNLQVRLSDGTLTEIENSEFTLYEVLNFAAMIERETKFSKDRPLVGDVLYKRYTEPGWTLGIDATLLYEQGDWGHVLTRAELDADTPYNSRVNAGLPPTPICNPGIESIKGFVYREENPYYYYVSDLSGNIYYGRNAAEHRDNINNYLNK